MIPPNLLKDLPSSLPTEWLTTLLEHRQLRIERIVSTGQSSPPDFWYDQPQHEWVLLLQGQATLQFENEALVTLEPGDHCFLEAHRKHRVAWTLPDVPTVWLAIFFDP